ncbi:hypothetical protein SAMN05192588_0787 [Nonlabens sp. Hel1_33_55]|uniref:hypothetical protein n=1 Tax=Nonlabens sp. Hel1_33_55 TaxID=1336802 RepID=UPI000875CA84|nr:hypothetical protein [Nonlabens sp. Hel1_33_55]SCY02565.1 hypothetical protein SAMN05192588_0787 [Nonlabens sp. Hel1_33_55]
MKVFITNFNANRIVSNLRHNFYYPDDAKLIKLFKWLNVRERSVLYSYYFLYNDPNKLLRQYRKIKSHKNEYVYESQPSFHLTKECKLLSASYNNFEIPKSIIEQGIEKIEEYRSFFLENKKMLEDQSELFNERIRWKFNLDELPQKISFDNSGYTEKTNYDLDDLRKKIKVILRKTQELINSSRKNEIIISNYGENSFLIKKDTVKEFNHIDYSISEILEVLKKFHNEFKEPYKKYMQELFRFTSNPELEFDSTILEQLGLSLCPSCENSNALDHILITE